MGDRAENEFLEIEHLAREIRELPVSSVYYVLSPIAQNQLFRTTSFASTLLRQWLLILNRLASENVRLVNDTVLPYGVSSLSALNDGTLVVHTAAPLRFEDQERTLEGDLNPDASETFVYLDTEDKDTAAKVFAAVDQLVDALGYEGPIDEQTYRGSIIRRSFAKVRQALTSADLKERMQRVEYGLELAGIGIRQSQADEHASTAVSNLIGSIAEIPHVVIKAGSILLIKYEDATIGKVLIVRQMSPLEMVAWSRFPEIQVAQPHRVLLTLATAVASLSDDEQQAPSPGLEAR